MEGIWPLRTTLLQEGEKGNPTRKRQQQERDWRLTITRALTAERAKQLADELGALSKQQSAAMLSAAYLKMSKEDGERFDRRAVRIRQICDLLGIFAA